MLNVILPVVAFERRLLMGSFSRRALSFVQYLTASLDTYFGLGLVFDCGCLLSRGEARDGRVG